MFLCFVPTAVCCQLTLPAYADPLLPHCTAQALGKAPTFGIRDSRSIKDQRESLPIYKLREQLIQAIQDNQVCVLEVF